MVIAIIWFRGIEFRIFFIMVMTTLPAFTFQMLDAYRAMSKDLFEMTLAFRPTRLDLFRTLVWPTVIAGHSHGMEGQSRQCRAGGRRR